MEQFAHLGQGELPAGVGPAAGLAWTPPAVITLTARFARASWKYGGQGYALVLRDTGAALQTLGLVSTAMGLPSWALGTAEIEKASESVGLDWRRESPVGHLVLGSRAAAGPVAGPPGGRPGGGLSPS